LTSIREELSQQKCDAKPMNFASGYAQQS